MARGAKLQPEELSGSPAPGDPRRSTREVCLMSNIVSQQRKGHVVWGKLENEHRHVVADASKGIKVVWLISGPVFLNGQAEKVIGPDRVGAPHAVYKIIGWLKADGGFTACGYIIKQDESGSDLATLLESIDKIEAETGLDFFADLDDEVEEELESVRSTTLWSEE
jgi:endonuclease G